MDLDKLVKLKHLCLQINKTPENSYIHLRELNELIRTSPEQLLKTFKHLILSSLYHFLKPPDTKLSFKEEHKELVVDTLTALFTKTICDKATLFFNIYAFLLNEIYDPDNKRLVRSTTSEEYKLSLINCMIALTNSLSWGILTDIYCKANAPKLSQIIYVSLELAKTEKLRTLRIAAIECISSIAKVNDETTMYDLEICNQIADVLMFFLPGLSTGLRTVALEDEKIGHKIPQVAIRAWGRIINILMQDYNASDNKCNIIELQSQLKQICRVKSEAKSEQKWRSDAEVKEYIEKSKRTLDWYKETDNKLQHIVVTMKKLCHHSHPNVRSELATASALLLKNCSNTMPKSLGVIVEILIVLSEDDDGETSRTSTSALHDLSNKLSSDLLINLLQNLEENFYSTMNSMPRIFNGIDEREQLVSLNLLVGYVRLFGKYKLIEVLHSPTHLRSLILTIVHISELERSQVQSLQEYGIQDLTTHLIRGTPWKNFRYFNNDVIVGKIQQLCVLLSQEVIVDIVTDFLLDVFINDEEHRKEATFILNAILSDEEKNHKKSHIIKTVINTYLDPVYWNVPITVTIDEYGNTNTLMEVRSNIIQTCLQVEGVGKMALALGLNFQDLLLKTLYAVLEKAGSGHPLIKIAGLQAITNISLSCKYANVTELINKNSDYFSYHVIRKLKRYDQNESVLNVLAVVMDHSTMDVLPSISDIVDGVLMQSLDVYQEKNANAFLRIFDIFIKCLMRWLDIKPVITPIKSISQRRKELENLTASIPLQNDFSDGIMDKTAQEMYNEDLEKDQELEFESDLQECKKPEPPTHVKLTVSILKRSLNFLPSKDTDRKLIVLEILRNGVEVVRDWEDELLPIVHQIWSPLVSRFSDEPLIVNLSFQLLVALARLSKDFIRSRTIKDVMPSLLEILQNLSKDSFLKDKGSSYRYTQAYKLQVELLENFAVLAADLEISKSEMDLVMQSIIVYLNDKQPLPLQICSVNFYKRLAEYDVDSVKEFILKIKERNDKDEYNKNVNALLNIL